MTRPADSWASAMSTTARPFGSHSYKLCGSGTVTAPPCVPGEERPGDHCHSPYTRFHAETREARPPKGTGLTVTHLPQPMTGRRDRASALAARQLLAERGQGVGGRQGA